MELRRATSDDWRASRDIRIRALTEAPDAFCSTLDRELGFDEDEWRRRVIRGITVLAWEGEQVVGTATGKVDPHEESSKELVAMWVDPAHRGEGIATALIESVLAWALGEGAPALALWVAEDNERAVGVYEKCGFVATGERDVMRPDVDQVRMRRLLPASPA